MAEPSTPRVRAVQRVKNYLQRHGSPRMQMVFFLTLTGLAGFVCSVLLHAAGLWQMAIRYPISVAFAYLVFLFLLYLWLRSFSLRHRQAPGQAGYVYTDPGPYYLGPDPVPSSRPAAAQPAPQPARGKGSGWGGDLGGDGDAAFLVIVLIVIAVGAALVASVFILVEAPVLLAEVLVNGLLVAGLGRRTGAPGGPHWTAGVIRRTWLPAVVVAVIFGLVGFGLEQLVPGATTMGEALHGAQGR
jgi:hypothetical protein